MDEVMASFRETHPDWGCHPDEVVERSLAYAWFEMDYRLRELREAVKSQLKQDLSRVMRFLRL
jgi:hypothetical protein